MEDRHKVYSLCSCNQGESTEEKEKGMKYPSELLRRGSLQCSRVQTEPKERWETDAERSESQCSDQTHEGAEERDGF